MANPFEPHPPHPDEPYPKVHPYDPHRSQEWWGFGTDDLESDHGHISDLTLTEPELARELKHRAQMLAARPFPPGFA